MISLELLKNIQEEVRNDHGYNNSVSIHFILILLNAGELFIVGFVFLVFILIILLTVIFILLFLFKQLICLFETH